MPRVRIKTAVRSAIIRLITFSVTSCLVGGKEGNVTSLVAGHLVAPAVAERAAVSRRVAGVGAGRAGRDVVGRTDGGGGGRPWRGAFGRDELPSPQQQLEQDLVQQVPQDGEGPHWTCLISSEVQSVTFARYDGCSR